MFLTTTRGQWWAAYLLGAALSMLVVWGQPLPPGIDLPQFANALQILTGYSEAETSYAFYYYLNFFNPYTGSYLLAWPFAELGGAVFGTKVVLSLGVLLTPVGLSAWLRELGVDYRLGVLGFGLAFGFPFQWGFLSFLLSAPVAYFYLTAVTRLRKARSWRRLGVAALLAVVLFFTHGATFTTVMAASGLATLFQRNLRKVVFELVHFVPAGLVFLPWYLGQLENATGKFAQPPTVDRFVHLFGGSFYVEPHFWSALAGLALALFFFVFGRPVLARSGLRVLPAAIGLVGLFFVPETVGDTWLVGTRFLYFVHLFALAAVDFHPEGIGRRLFLPGVFAATLVMLLVTYHRVRVFNEELSGLLRLREVIPQGSDIQYHQVDHTSRTMGPANHSHVGAWLPAFQGGLLENDFGRFWNNPVKRRAGIPWPNEYTFHVARGSKKRVVSRLGKLATFEKQAGEFLVLRRQTTQLALEGLRVVRATYVQGRPTLRSLPEAPSETAVRMRAPTVLELRPTPGVQRLEGAVRGTEHASEREPLRLRILDVRRRVLWESKPQTGASPSPESFTLPLSELEGSLFLHAAGGSGNSALLVSVRAL